MHISVLNSTPLNRLYYPNLPFHVTLDASPHQIQPPSYKNCFKNVSLSLRGGGSSEPNEPPLDAPLHYALLSCVPKTCRRGRTVASIPSIGTNLCMLVSECNVQLVSVSTWSVLSGQTKSDRRRRRLNGRRKRLSASLSRNV